MIIPVEEKKFLNYTRNYIFQILKLGKNSIQKKTSLLSKEETFGDQLVQQFFTEIKGRL